MFDSKYLTEHLWQKIFARIPWQKSLTENLLQKILKRKSSTKNLLEQKKINTPVLENIQIRFCFVTAVHVSSSRRYLISLNPRANINKNKSELSEFQEAQLPKQQAKSSGNGRSVHQKRTDEPLEPDDPFANLEHLPFEGESFELSNKTVTLECQTFTKR